MALSAKSPSLQDTLRAEAMEHAMKALVERLKRFSETNWNRTIRSLTKPEALLIVDGTVCAYIEAREQQRSKLAELGILDPFSLDPPPRDPREMYKEARALEPLKDPRVPFDDPLPESLTLTALSGDLLG